MTPITAPTQFINVLVKVKPGMNKGEYIFETAPAIPYVTLADTVINYQIFDTSGYDIAFTGMTVTPDNDQLSTASLSKSRKLLTFSDANTKKITLNINLNFTDAEGSIFSHDPQVQNEPSQE